MREKLKQYLEANGIKLSVFCRDNNLAYTTIDGILKGRTDEMRISTDTAILVADGMGITVEELYDRKIPQPDREIELLRLFRMFNSRGQETIIDVVRGLSENPEYKKGLSVSNGGGNLAANE